MAMGAGCKFVVKKKLLQNIWFHVAVYRTIITDI